MKMEKLTYLAVVAVMISSCDYKSNSKTELEKASLDSIQQVKVDSPLIPKAEIQPQGEAVRRGGLARVSCRY